MRSPAERTPSTEERNRKKNDTQKRITQMKGPASAGLKEKRSNPLFSFYGTLCLEVRLCIISGFVTTEKIHAQNWKR